MKRNESSTIMSMPMPTTLILLALLLLLIFVLIFVLFFIFRLFSRWLSICCTCYLIENLPIQDRLKLYLYFQRILHPSDNLLTDILMYPIKSIQFLHLVLFKFLADVGYLRL